MKVVFRTDASILIGTGHLMRCLLLADELRDLGVQVSFICKELPGNLCDYVEKRRYTVYRLSPDSDVQEVKRILSGQENGADWLVVDHYDLDYRWEKEMRPLVSKIMVLDDLANRPHDCDLLLDQNYYINMDIRYKDLVPEHCCLLLGPTYVLLRHEFIEARKKMVMRDGIVKKILLFFGGSDFTNETTKSLEAIRLLKQLNFDVDVIVGSSNPYKEQVEAMCTSIPRVNYYCQVDNMAQMMVSADLAIGAGGITSWERCYLGLPSITIVVAQNQAETTEAIAHIGAVWNLGWHDNVSVEMLAQVIEKAMKCPNELKKLGKKGQQFWGSEPFKVAEIMLGY